MWQTDLEKDLLAELGRRSFRSFAKYCFGIVRHPKNRWWDEAVHGPICDWYDAQIKEWLANRHSKTASRRFLAILIPRACGKSVLITQCGMLWLHLQDPDISTYIGASTKDLAISFLGSIKKVLEGYGDAAYWRWLFGNWRSDDARWRQDRITHGARRMSRAEESFAVWSASSGITGKHPDVLCMDDLVTKEAIDGDSDWINHAYEHLSSLIPVVESNGLVILVGTRYADNDPFGRSFDKEGIATIAGQTDDPDYKVTKGGLWHVYFLSGKNPDGSAAIPTCWSLEAMDHYYKRDPVMCAFQVYNRPRALTFKPLTESAFDSHLVKEVPKFAVVTMHIDTAFRYLSRQSAEHDTVLISVAHHIDIPGTLTVLAVDHSPTWTAHDLMEKVVERALQWDKLNYQIIAITDEVETGGKGGVFQGALFNHFVSKSLERLWPEFHAFNRGHEGKTKDARISSAINYVAEGYVKFVESAPGLAVLRYQLCNHPFSGRKDAADAFADALHPDIYSTKVPASLYKFDKEPFCTPQEDALKGYNWWLADDSMLEYDRRPVGRSG